MRSLICKKNVFIKKLKNNFKPHINPILFILYYFTTLKMDCILFKLIGEKCGQTILITKWIIFSVLFSPQLWFLSFTQALSFSRSDGNQRPCLTVTDPVVLPFAHQTTSYGDMKVFCLRACVCVSVCVCARACVCVCVTDRLLIKPCLLTVSSN